MMLSFPLMSVALLLALPAHGAQLCTNQNNVDCLAANGNGWGCNPDGDAGDCCKGKCCDPDCSLWCCEQIAAIDDADVCEDLLDVYDEFIEVVETTCSAKGGADDSNMRAWFRLTERFARAVAPLTEPVKSTIPTKFRCKRNNKNRNVIEAVEFEIDDFSTDTLAAVVEFKYQKSSGKLVEIKSSLGNYKKIRQRCDLKACTS